MAEAAGPVDRNPALFAGLRRARLEGEPAQRRSRHPEGAVERTYDQPSRSLQAPGHASTAHFRDHNRASLLTHDAHRRGGGSPGLENGTRPNPRPQVLAKNCEMVEKSHGYGIRLRTSRRADRDPARHRSRDYRVAITPTAL
jgi:hypothetical protein